MIGVTGCVRDLPIDFPLIKSENAGNMIHGDAPFKIFPDTVHATDTERIRGAGASNFVDFVNNECTHLVLTIANALRLGETSLPNLGRMEKLIRSVKKPIVTFGLGGQSQDDDISSQQLAPEAISFLRMLSEKSALIGVRGEITAEIVRKKAGVSNVFVTGCPSIFSHPEGVAQVRFSGSPSAGRPAFNGTKLHYPDERKLLEDAIKLDNFLVEPVNRFNHRYFLEVTGGFSQPSVPYFLAGLVRRDREVGKNLPQYFRANYRLFRSTASWIEFIKESVSYSYGSRFHANMAALLGGSPALWLTHDSRTREMVDYMCLPNIPINKFDTDTLSTFDWAGAYRKFSDNFDSILDRFHKYLSTNGLPTAGVSEELFRPKDYSLPYIEAG